MTKTLDIAAWPMAFFVKIVPITRVTLENWMRSGAVVPAQDGELTDGGGGVFGGKKFSLRNLIKVETMYRLSRFGIPPSHGSSLADRIIEDFEPQSHELFENYLFGREVREYNRTYFDVGKSPAMGEVAPIGLTVPIGKIFLISFMKINEFLEWSDIERAKLRKKFEDIVSKGVESR